MQPSQYIIAKYPRTFISGSKEPLFNEDTFYANIEDKKPWGGAAGRLFGASEKLKRINTNCFTYELERKILNILIDKIFEKNSEKFQEREDVFEVFAKSIITGDILPMGRLIDSTFGRGTLRRIGELDQNIQEQENFVNSL